MNAGNPAPVAIFVYNRADHLEPMLAALMDCPEFGATDIHVFADGPKKPEHQAAVEETRGRVQAILADRATYHFQDANRGLGRSIRAAVEMLCARYGRVIVVEDDLVVAPGFLTWMNAALDRYADAPDVYQVSGHMFDSQDGQALQRPVMLPFTTTWGWGTWARAWEALDWDLSSAGMIMADRARRRAFNLNGVYDYTSMVRRQLSGRIDSWGIRWYLSVFARKGLVVYPPVSLVENRGVTGPGTHGGSTLRRYGHSVAGRTATTTDWPLPEHDAAALASARKAIWYRNGGFAGWAVDMLKRILRR
jgi:hypothetical protein